MHLKTSLFEHSNHKDKQMFKLGQRKRFDYSHVRLWLGVVFIVQFGIVGFMVLEGWFHVSGEPDNESKPIEIKLDGDAVLQIQSSMKNASRDGDAGIHGPAIPHYEKWMDELFWIPTEALAFQKKEGGPLGIPANYTVAVKLFKEDRKIQDDAVNEMDLHAAVHNPNIVRFLGTVWNKSMEGMDSTPVGFMMEHYPGTQLEDILDELSDRNLPPIPQAARYKIALDIALSLEYLHSINIIHFDVKPEQILVRGFPPDDGPVSAKLIDFGMALRWRNGAKYVNGELEGGTRWRGTKHYLAPELVINEKHVTEKADVYSYGVVLWEMYTRGYPYRGHKMSYVLDRIRDRNPIGLNIPTDCEDEWKSLVRDCMQWNPEERPSFRQISDRLAEILNNILQDSTSGRNGTNSVWLESGFDEQDLQERSKNEWEVVGVYHAPKQKMPGGIGQGEKDNPHEASGLCLGSNKSRDSARSVRLNTHSVGLEELQHGRDLGMGEYGEVYLSNLTVRAKFFKDVNSKSMKEARVLSTLVHPNIVHLLGIIVDGYMVSDAKSVPVMSGIVTEDLGNKAAALDNLDPKKRLSSKSIGAIISQLALAVAHTHSHDLVLVGLNPGNIVIQNWGPGGLPLTKITDVSLAQCSQGEWKYDEKVKSRHGGFIAPEVLARGRPTGKSDVYSLGKIMKFMCRDGRTPSPAPVGCSSKWRALVAQCTLPDPLLRPDAVTIFTTIQQMGNKQSGSHAVTQHSPQQHISEFPTLL